MMKNNYFKEQKDGKKKVKVFIVLTLAALQLVACSLEPTCKAEDCEETEIYEDGYCRYHYYENVGGNIMKDILN